MRYAKVFSSLWDGSMRGHPNEILVFINLLTHSDEQGIVDRHWRTIIDETGLSEEQVRNSLGILSGVDKESRTPDEEGRRIVPLDEHRSWGWRIVNHAKYRELCTREQNAERQARHRKRNGEVTGSHTLPVGVDVGVVVSEFNTWWEAYPRKDAKKDATKAWFQTFETRPTIADVIAAVKRAISSEQWKKEKGKFIPMPATWLRGERWNDGGVKIVNHRISAPEPTPEEKERYNKAQAAIGGALMT